MIVEDKNFTFMEGDLVLLERGAEKGKIFNRREGTYKIIKALEMLELDYEIQHTRNVNDKQTLVHLPADWMCKKSSKSCATASHTIH